MNAYILQEAIGMVGDDLIAEADKPITKKLFKKRWIWAVASCLVLVICAIPIFSLLSEQTTEPNIPNSDPIANKLFFVSETGTSSGKPLPPQAVSVSCDSFVACNRAFELEIKLGTAVAYVPTMQLEIGSYSVENENTQAFTFNGSSGLFVSEIDAKHPEVLGLDDDFLPRHAIKVDVSPVYIEENAIGIIKVRFGTDNLAAIVNLYYAVSNGYIYFSFDSPDDAIKNSGQLTNISSNAPKYPKNDNVCS